MAKYRVKVVRQARDHLKGIKEYIDFELFAPEAARNMLNLLHQSIRSLADDPYRIKTIDEEPWGSQGISKTRVKNYCWCQYKNAREQCYRRIAAVS